MKGKGLCSRGVFAGSGCWVVSAGRCARRGLSGSFLGSVGGCARGGLLFLLSLGVGPLAHACGPSLGGLRRVRLSVDPFAPPLPSLLIRLALPLVASCGFVPDPLLCFSPSSFPWGSCPSSLPSLSPPLPLLLPLGAVAVGWGGGGGAVGGGAGFPDLSSFPACIARRLRVSGVGRGFTGGFGRGCLLLLWGLGGVLCGLGGGSVA